ncbi:GntP family permease [Streptococcus equi subsp. zooepidemicus]|uniref:GntP family permease n=1 Tax=Streptococcus equi TaxID=1336 RepID=UPI0002174F13|nr:GntP family permease [Streptococcus equi]AEJ25780.1 D-beta-hydroxybutyrate permease [Streptococcus equi subsp. zooepidemicus ATCC 35246]AIA67259.1 cytochrome C biogenesis protein CcmE [Streptococcus equi subsp. zooepidemicus CY]MBR7684771.1 GntP family permease [Streptococcus equi subsp. zooepidemicus]MBR7753788.1 GntP family permease [Streptococcus equi subsp. zooepidemicus]MBR7776795.1 GntP family permease [Streptococcus equi subsp. zooepidemicus]
MEFLGPIGVLLGIIAIVYFSLKEIHITIAAPMATILVVFLNSMPLVESILGKEPNNYMGALGGYIMSYFAIFLLGSILAKLMEVSGATISIAEFILKKVGYQNPYRILVAIFIISAILTYGGISLFVVMFAVLPLARSLFKKMDLSWNLIQVPLWLGIATFTMTILPGTPAIQNVIPIQYLNTSLTAALVPSILGSVGCIAFGLFYMKRCLTKSLEVGENYATYTSQTNEDTTERVLPPFVASILPLILLIVIAIIGSLLGDEFVKKNIIYVALLTGIISAIVLFNKYIDQKIATLSIGASGAVGPIFATASAVAFGSVVTAASGFGVFSDIILNIPGPPVISLTVLTSAMAAITGSSSGALGIVMPNFAQYYLDAGVSPEIIHRVAAVASNILTIVPQSGVFLTFLSLTGLNHKNGFKQTFITVFGGTLVAESIIMLTSLFF